MLVTNLFLDDNEQIADILIADGFDPGTIFQSYLNLRTTHSEINFRGTHPY